MFYVLLTLVALGVWLFCLFDVLATDEADMRYLPKFGWFLTVLLGIWLGAILWLLGGRPRAVAGPAKRPRLGAPDSDATDPPRGPDDDPEFLRNLERRIRGDE